MWSQLVPKKAQPQFSAHVYCGQTAEWMKTSLGTEVDLDPGHIVLDWAEVYLRTKWHLDPSSHWATTDMGHKLGGGSCAPLGERELGPHLTQCGLG